MDENTIKTIKDKFNSLPESIQEVILSSGYQDNLGEIGQQHNLNFEQVGILERETTMIMMGLTPLKDFEVELTSELNIDKISSSKIVESIQEKIFSNVQDLIKLMNTPLDETPQLDDINYEDSKLDFKLDKRFEKLPSEVRKIIAESNYQTTLYDIARENELNIIQTSDLEKTVTNLIIGTIHPDKLEESVKNILGLPDEKIRKIVDEVNNKILKELRAKVIQPSNTIIPDTEEDKKNNAQILNNAGIEIVPEKLELTPAEKTTEAIPKSSILAQKLSGSIAIPSVKTEHSLPNMSSSAPTTNHGKPAADPYREIPE